MSYLQVDRLLSSNPQNDSEFGYSVAVDGYHAVAGARSQGAGDEGAAYVIRRNTSNNWESVTNLTPNGGVIAAENFGHSVDIKNDFIVVGSPGHNGNRGRVSVFHRDDETGDTWTLVSTLIPADVASNDYFGISVSISVTHLVVGANRDDDIASDCGTAFIYARDTGANTWSLITKLVPSDGSAGDYFGISVGVDNDYAVVGSYRDDDNGFNSGSAYIYYKDQGGKDNWGQFQKIVQVDAEQQDLFGYSVDISSNYIIVGAFQKNSDNYLQEGAAYIFRKNSQDIWSQIKKIQPSDDDSGHSAAHFGKSVSIRGDYAVVGYEGNRGERGAADIFFKQQDWAWKNKLTDSSGVIGDFLGFSVAVAHPHILLGSPGEGTDRGRVIVYEEPLTVLRLAQQFTVSNYTPTKASVYLKRIGTNSSESFQLSTAETVIDACNFISIAQRSNKIIIEHSIGNFTGDGYMIVSPIFDLLGSSDDDMPVLRYPIQSDDDRKYYLWLRVLPSVIDGTFEADILIDGEVVKTITSTSHVLSAYDWFWVGDYIVMPDTDSHILGIRLKGRGASLDKIYLDSSEVMPYAAGPGYSVSPYLTVHLRLSSSLTDDTPGLYLYIYDYKNTIDEVKRDDWYNFDINFIDNRSAIAFNGNYFIIMNVTGNNQGNFILWELVDSDEYYIGPSAIRI